MELIKNGSSAHPEEWEAEVTCARFDQYDSEGCGALYAIDPTGLVLRYFKGAWSTNYYTAIRCEQCDKYTRVFDVPQAVLKVIRTKKAMQDATFDGVSHE